MQHLYPLKFHPILKEKIWGGKKLSKFLNKKSTSNKTGESWEISDVDNNTSIICNGALKGQSLTQLIETFTTDVVGYKNYKTFGSKFPLLIKFIDAKEDLSIQLHPNDELAKARHNSFGKTEMWYVMQANQNSNLIVGFNQKVTPEKYLQHLEKNTLTKILNFESVKEGDTYFIDVGRIHAIGAGVMLAEIQQTSDITYRVYDWGRVDDKGNERELHNDLAIDAINFNANQDFQINYSKLKNNSNEMVKCKYFTTNFINLDSSIEKENTYDSFIIYICVEGAAQICGDFGEEAITKGETILMPASIKSFYIKSQKAELLEVYV